MEVSITKEQIEELYRHWKQLTRHMPRQRKRFNKNYASLPLPNPDVFRYPEDYTVGEIAGEEYLYAVKRHQALLNVVPDLTPPQEKISKIDARLKSMVLPTEPARKIPRSAVRVTGVRHNSKAPYPAEWESRIECDFLTLLEFDPAVARYYTQPLSFGWTDTKGEEHQYTPDVLVVWHPDENGQEIPNWLVDMKSASDLIHADKELHQKFQEARIWARNKGWVFKALTEHQVRSPLLENIKFFHRHLHEPSSPEAVEMARLIIQRVFAQQSPTPASLLATFPKEEQKSVVYVLWMLVSRREICCDLTVPLDEEKTILWLPEKYTEERIMSSIILGKEVEKLNGRKRKGATQPR